MQDPPSVEEFWEDFLGTRLAPGTRVVPHAGLAGYAGVWFFVRDQCCVVSAPAHWCAPLEAALERATLDSLMSPEGFEAVFGDAFDRTIGPSWLGWLPPGELRGADDDRVRPATAADLSSLRGRVAQEDWEAAGLEAGTAVGLFRREADGGDEEIVSAASLRVWSEGVVGPGVLSTRAGAGQVVVAAVCRSALRDGKLVVYQTLRENERAVGLARRLGFRFFASHLAVRLKG